MPENSSARSPLITTGVLVIALAAVFFVGRSLGDEGDRSSSSSTTESFGVVTSGQASVNGTPDQLSFTASVHNTKSTTAAAMAKTNHDVRAITIAAKQNGVEAKDIQTRSISVRPSYSYKGGRHLVGYGSSQQIKIMVRDLDKAGEVIGAVTTAAGNAVSIGGVNLSISNQKELIAKARTAAVKKSKAAAEALAEAAGREVGELEYVAEVQPQGYGYRSSYNQAGLFDMDTAAALPGPALSAAISPGKQQVSVTVSVRWSLAD